MSKTTENSLVARRYADAWVAGDLAAIVGCYHDDFTLHYGGANPFSGSHRGKAAALSVLSEVTRRTGRKLLEIVDVTAGPERAVVLAREFRTRRRARHARSRAGLPGRRRALA